MSAVLRFAEMTGHQLASDAAKDIQSAENHSEAVAILRTALIIAFKGTSGKVTDAVADGVAMELAVIIACGLGSVEGYEKPAWLSSAKETQAEDLS